jgi:hypothetical protein
LHVWVHVRSAAAPKCFRAIAQCALIMQALRLPLACPWLALGLRANTLKYAHVTHHFDLSRWPAPPVPRCGA